MSAHDWFDEQCEAFALGLLDAQDAATFAAHLPGCEACRAEIARVEDDLRWLPMAAGPAAPRPGLRRRIVDDVLGEARPSRGPRWGMFAALAAGLLLAVGGWFAGQRRAAAADAELATLRTALAALQDTLSVERGAGRVLQASVERDGARGGVLIFADERTHRWSVVVHGLPPAPPNGRYQFWFVCEEGMVRGREIEMPGARPAAFTTGMPTVPCTVKGAALSVEPMDATSGPPRGDMIAHLML